MMHQPPAEHPQARDDESQDAAKIPGPSAGAIAAWRLCIDAAQIRLGEFNWPMVLTECLDEIDRLRATVAAIREVRSCLGAGPMDYEAFVDEVDAALAAVDGPSGSAVTD